MIMINQSGSFVYFESGLYVKSGVSRNGQKQDESERIIKKSESNKSEIYVTIVGR